jgi:hypothetical protein
MVALFADFSKREPELGFPLSLWPQVKKLTLGGELTLRQARDLAREAHGRDWRQVCHSGLWCAGIA